MALSGVLIAVRVAARDCDEILNFTQGPIARQSNKGHAGDPQLDPSETSTTGTFIPALAQGLRREVLVPTFGHRF